MARTEFSKLSKLCILSEQEAIIFEQDYGVYKYGVQVL